MPASSFATAAGTSGAPRPAPLCFPEQPLVAPGDLLTVTGSRARLETDDGTGKDAIDVTGKHAIDVTGKHAIYAMGAVERMVGVDAATVHDWEQRWQLPVPARSPGGQLLYSRDDIERLRLVAHRVARGEEPRPMAASNGQEAESPNRAPLLLGEAPRLLILLAEREPRATDLTEFFLRTEGYAVDVTFSAEDTERRCIESEPALVVVELSVSGHSGIALCRRLRSLSSAPIIAVSTLDLSDMALAAGAEAFLHKPLDPLALVSTVKDLLGTSAFALRANAVGEP